MMVHDLFDVKYVGVLDSSGVFEVSFRWSFSEVFLCVFKKGVGRLGKYIRF